MPSELNSAIAWLLINGAAVPVISAMIAIMERRDKVEGRKCPHCGEERYSAVSQEDWECDNCGATIPKRKASPDDRKCEADHPHVWGEAQRSVLNGGM